MAFFTFIQYAIAPYLNAFTNSVNSILPSLHMPRHFTIMAVTVAVRRTTGGLWTWDGGGDAFP